MLERIRKFIPQMVREDNWIGIGFYTPDLHSICAAREFEMGSLDLKILITLTESLAEDFSPLRTYKAPFAAEVLDGEFEMTWGQSPGSSPPIEIEKTLISEGDSYEFDSPELWQSLRLLTPNVLTLVVLGPKYQVKSTPSVYSECYRLETETLWSLLTQAELAL